LQKQLDLLGFILKNIKERHSNMTREIKEDLVSIITPTYNSNKFLRDTLDCVIAQTYKNWDLIIIDDGSTDNTLLILEEYSKINPLVFDFLATSYMYK